MIGVGMVLQVSSGSPCPKDMGSPPLSRPFDLKRTRRVAALVEPSGLSTADLK